MLLRQGSTLQIARRLHEGSLTLGEAFTFMSGLYFRGKITYAERFAAVPGAALVITPTRGLQSPDLIVSEALLREFAGVDIAADDERYREPLERDLSRVVSLLADGARVVLLGSIATGKYVDVLVRALGTRLHYPADFIGRGDMSRGGLLLRQAASGVELEYAPLDPAVKRRGPRPPKLDPLTRVGL